MEKKKVTVWIAGAAGDGIASTGEMFAKTCARSGLYLFANNSYQSVIRGGHVFYQVRVGEEKVYSQGDFYDFLIALNMDAILQHAGQVSPGGGVLYNSDRLKPTEKDIPSKATAYPLPVGTLVKNPVMQNTVAVGALMKLIGLPFETLAGVVKDTFGKKKADVIEMNVSAARAGYEYAAKNFKPLDFGLKAQDKRRLVMTGNQAIALGALAAGCKFYAAYPMTPASGILHWLAAHGPSTGMAVKQAEDEIAVINMAIGASHVGARAMCGTSGGGFALMTEAVGLSGITETPLVIAEVQRGGPSTGLPTKTEQGDLFQVLGASQGDFPKIVIAPLSVEDAFCATVEAFNLADKYQCPVIVMSDLYLSEHMETIDGLEMGVKIDRGEVMERNGNGKPYLRYRLTESGISPRALPGTEGTLYIAGSDEHDEKGDLISDVFTNPPARVKMMEKRMRKMEGALAEMAPPKLFGPENAEITLVIWGSTSTLARDVLRILQKEGISANALEIRNVWPFHAAKVSEILSKCKRTLMIEASYSGQMARLIRQETGVEIKNKYLKYDGEPFSPGETYKVVKNILAGKSGTFTAVSEHLAISKRSSGGNSNG